MKIYRYQSVFDGILHHKMTDDFGESNTDKSFYTPSVATARSTLGSGSPPARTLIYDFDDGKDTGERLQVLLRTKGLDPTEIDRIGEILSQRVDQDKNLQAEEILEAARKLEGKKLNDYLKSIADTITGNSVSASADSSK